ncbi:ribosomal RNA large subunit methyltransferase H [Aureimonas endophytica]|uniref:Ribosomal RNA large subunit methyltransferase H n=1 Tax=Aureimonas endophytica TaxID=2027858 RepID=A0A917E3E8_9HYPH|nr:23S rRNA (pseudouridine(1915)-N(3))-methyltransferase RlmH [Aureimonas endophytica]GGD97114.1 ribosomal RNA large subunit methyltransferase H [Aureimonas endophytica]
MRVTVAAVGRMKAGLERELAQRYFDRLAKAGGAIGLDYAGLLEETESRAQTVAERKRDEAGRLLAALPDKAALCLLDETGKTFSSEEFANRLATIRDEGQRDLAILIGGPDGLDPELRARARLVVAFGAMTWPHQIVRILLAEQLYRAATILSGHPYHRA